ncbi:hypothetical protein CAPTEDRAFT_201356 [Capitella teleta]|uniref:WD repeat-containing protein 76 n=1 Tax=Capitella teleta TaxID=283909 RepID=R7THS3_CAPTE|nr:hypothetical protein CAPTEDRAFT_201356 [Capitella teleta]|eukprot:ELT91111.1 hypothetical protein CAPTEDRAFT_201356 [Capitella teleta]
MKREAEVSPVSARMTRAKRRRTADAEQSRRNADSDRPNAADRPKPPTLRQRPGSRSKALTRNTRLVLNTKSKPALKSEVEHQKDASFDEEEDMMVKLNTNNNDSKNELDEPESDAENSIDFEDSDDQQESFFEMRRKKNVEDNARFLEELNISELTADLKASTQKRNKPSMNGLARVKPEKEILPRRFSLRIRRQGPDGTELPPLPDPEPVEEHPRRPLGPSKMKKDVIDKVKEIDAETFVLRLQGLNFGAKEILVPEVSAFKNMTLKASCVAKVVPSRIFSLAVHPCEEHLLVAAGSKWGELGIWNADAEQIVNDSVCCFTPHSRPVNHLVFSALQPQQLFSCSYDGTLKCADLKVGEFLDTYITPEDDDIRLNCFDLLSDSSLVVSQSDGRVALVDPRVGTLAQSTSSLHMKSIRGINIHPNDDNYFITASVDTTIGLWDRRKLSKGSNKPLQTLNHAKSVDSARFSPNGRYILSCSIDDQVKVFDSSNLSKITLHSSMRFVFAPFLLVLSYESTDRHNNQTGRWLTNFKPSWHPVSEDIFVIGSMDRPRRIEIFDNKCRSQHKLLCADNLNSVCSLNVFHPSRNVVIGGNSSGRVHIFK